MKQPTTVKRKRGRPAKMVDGLRVTDLPAFTTRLRPAAKAQLQAIAAEQGLPAYAVLDAGIAHVYQALPPAKRKRVDARLALDAGR